MTDFKSPHGVKKKPKTNRSSIFDGYITEAEYADQRGVSVRTCQRDRALRQAPPHVVLGKSVDYRVEAVCAWLAAQERAAERRPGPPRRSGGKH